MANDSQSTIVRLDVAESDGIDEVIIGFRKDGELYELAGSEPPVTAELRKP
jgi:hypothetical protein